MFDSRYRRVYHDLTSFIPEARLAADPLRTLAYGTDASFYRLIPKIVVRADSEAEVSRILRLAAEANTPVTFRAAGTSLSGQAISDSVLLVAGESWQRWEVMDEGARIRLEPGVIGARANQILVPYGRKIGPDPASINAAMIGGIAANNASGIVLRYGPEQLPHGGQHPHRPGRRHGAGHRRRRQPGSFSVQPRRNAGSPGTAGPGGAG